MAELILTEEEKALSFWEDLDDEALGKAVKYFAIKFSKKPMNDIDAVDNILTKAATIGMACRAYDMHAGKWEILLQDITRKGEPIGDWKITYERVK
jgi:hypothetical protein